MGAGASGFCCVEIVGGGLGGLLLAVVAGGLVDAALFIARRQFVGATRNGAKQCGFAGKLEKVGAGRDWLRQVEKGWADWGESVF